MIPPKPRSAFAKAAFPLRSGLSLLAVGLALSLGNAPCRAEPVRSFETTFGEALTLYRRMDFAGATRGFEEALALASSGAERSEAELQIGHARLYAADFEAARTAYGQVLQNPAASLNQKAEAQLYIGTSYYEGKEYAKAIEAYRHVAEFQPANRYYRLAATEMTRNAEQKLKETP